MAGPDARETVLRIPQLVRRSRAVPAAAAIRYGIRSSAAGPGSRPPRATEVYRPRTAGGDRRLRRRYCVYGPGTGQADRRTRAAIAVARHTRYRDVRSRRGV